MRNRISWEKYALSLAKTASIRSEDPYIKVGACALGYNNRVLGVAYNGLVTGKTVNEIFWKIGLHWIIVSKYHISSY
jgi:dCMP deaminase